MHFLISLFKCYHGTSTVSFIFPEDQKKNKNYNSGDYDKYCPFFKNSLQKKF